VIGAGRDRPLLNRLKLGGDHPGRALDLIREPQAGPRQKERGHQTHQCHHHQDLEQREPRAAAARRGRRGSARFARLQDVSVGPIAHGG
jgi:hypothetical protein